MQCTRLELAHACGPVAQNKDAAVTGTKIPQSAAHLGQSLAARRQEARHSRALAASPTSSAGPPRRASLRFAITPEDHRLGHLTCPPIALRANISTRGFWPLALSFSLWAFSRGTSESTWAESYAVFTYEY